MMPHHYNVSALYAGCFNENEVILVPESKVFLLKVNLLISCDLKCFFKPASQQKSNELTLLKNSLAKKI
jgi:hypothetical protein